jgi:hypothetical protein
MFEHKIPPMIRTNLVFACCIAVAARTAESKVWTRLDGRRVILLDIDETDCRDAGQKRRISWTSTTRLGFRERNQSLINLPSAAIWQQSKQLPCWPNAPFAELLRLSRSSVPDELYMSRKRTVIGE